MELEYNHKRKIDIIIKVERRKSKIFEKDLNLNHFEQLDILGEGSFAKVYKMKHRAS